MTLPTGRTAGTAAARTARRGSAALLVAGVFLIAANLRPAIIAVAPLVEAIRADTGLSATATGLLTTLPIVCLGALAPLAPRLAGRFGIEPVLLAVLAVLCAGFALRTAPPVLFLFAGSLLVGAAIAVGNVLVPSLVKRDFPSRVGLLTGAYTVMLSGCAAVAAGVTVPLMDALALPWRWALALWALPAVLALAVWAPQARRHTREPPRLPVRGLWRSALAWQVTCYMGLQSLHFYTLTAWTPAIFAEHGVDAESAGWLLSLAGLSGLPASLAVSLLAARSRRQGRYAAANVALSTAGVLGLLVAPVQGAYLWMVLLGLGQGTGISVALLLIVLRSPDTAHTTALSAMAQGVGYLLAAAGPVAIGLSHDLTGGWRAALVVLLVLLAAQLAAGLGAGRDLRVQGAVEPLPSVNIKRV
ncbi:CynX/NimT family MFS transporter [Allonocardiopsis opalescens]|uniref:CP family cyanate transporter-like MFS transporter n=1 Tax=Allonocardiopsis opalescens TaxID=1144618 RepID=A0A2T0Q6S1_9ACTN|nr:MFS transporter [Allonocardiopsis opalescens]PRX99527.1 CP family cyanate transporter-like MFS transporter [Allonocardiopsis opalescens]